MNIPIWKRKKYYYNILRVLMTTFIIRLKAVAAYLKVVRRRTSSSADGTRGGEHERGTPPHLRGSPPRKFWFFSASLCFFNWFLCVWDQISVTIFARKDISWRMRKQNAKQNRFQIVTIFFFYFFLQHIS